VPWDSRFFSGKRGDKGSQSKKTNKGGGGNKPIRRPSPQKGGGGGHKKVRRFRRHGKEGDKGAGVGQEKNIPEKGVPLPGQKEGKARTSLRMRKEHDQTETEGNSKIVGK